ncbi:ATP-binding protein [Riemerella anatipestifer]|uniref:ATP-binding protein n=1 Tax=Riemerella anatipestifer TaxID=34085 RepID=UPI0021F90601|nr:ATP-binding protein [Riemerella anatipestifer]MCW0487113.1 ATP-binding protein [Riemerella anatipestifer]
MDELIDYSQYKTVSAVPEASSMIETFRAIGYNIETAIADIIDNSISANAKNVWVNFEWLGSKTWLSIKDDGFGMNDSELIQAMRPGSKNPLQDRESKDLGRFGLGLKTASFSQARKLTVISKKSDYNSVYWTWDLDFVNQTGKWELIKYLPDEKFEKVLSGLVSGTIVIWNDIDRVVKNFKQDDNKALDKFLLIMEQVKKHLSMVFHKFMESGKINIYFQDQKIEPWNPFLLDEPSTQIFPEEKIQNGLVKIEGYVLPHKSKISEEKYKQVEGAKGWNEQQGFYIYRNERLLLAGDWLGLFRKEEHYKLTRIQIELPNTLDAEWQIDIKKSVARPPLIFREQIKAYAMKVRAQAVEVYRHKGKNVKPIVGQKFVPLWIDHKRGYKWFYKINREHPIIEKAKEEARNEPNKAIEMLIKFIEETIPTKSIFIKESEVPELQGKPFEGIDQEIIRNTMQAMYSNLIGQGKTDEQAKAIIANIEPFNNFVHFLEFLN